MVSRQFHPPVSRGASARKGGGWSPSYSFASSTMLNGVWVARRKVRKPAF